MSIEEQIMKLQTYKMYEGEDTVYVERDDVLKLLEQQPTPRNNLAESSQDCISRETAIDQFIHWYSELLLSQKEEVSFEDILKSLPSVLPQTKRGKWIEDAETYYKMLNERGLGVDEYTPYFTDDIACSVCLAKYSCIDNETQFFKYCPNCGADMRGESE